MLVAELTVSALERLRSCISGLLRKAPLGSVGVRSASADPRRIFMSLYVPNGAEVEVLPAESGGSKKGLCLLGERKEAQMVSSLYCIYDFCSIGLDQKTYSPSNVSGDNGDFSKVFMAETVLAPRAFSLGSESFDFLPAKAATPAPNALAVALFPLIMFSIEPLLPYLKPCPCCQSSSTSENLGPLILALLACLNFENSSTAIARPANARIPKHIERMRSALSSKPLPRCASEPCPSPDMKTVCVTTVASESGARQLSSSEGCTKTP